MSETSAAPRRVLFLVPEGLSPEGQEKLKQVASCPGKEIFMLTGSNGREALEKIFAADTVAVWGELVGK
jgi:hypothetical protein